MYCNGVVLQYAIGLYYSTLFPGAYCNGGPYYGTYTVLAYYGTRGAVLAFTDKKRPKNKDELIACCVEAWKEMSPSKIEIAYRLLPVVMRNCANCNPQGGNNFRIEHTGIREQMRKEGYPDLDC